MEIDYKELIKQKCRCEIQYIHRGGNSMGWDVCKRCEKLGKLINYLNKNLSPVVKASQIQRSAK